MEKKSLFEEFLLEMGVAKKGDWSEGSKYVGEFRAEGLEANYDFMKSIQDDLELYKRKDSLDYMIGFRTTQTLKTKLGDEVVDNFRIIFNIGMKKEPQLSSLGYNNPVSVYGVSTDASYQRSGIATAMYKYLVNEADYTIVGDREQYFGARRLWSRLSKDIDVIVDLIDVNNMEVIEKNVILHHGKYDHDFDERLWAYDDSKQWIRPVLTRIT